MTKALVLASAVALTAVSLTGCRSPRRAVRVGADAAQLTVTMTNLSPADANRPEWIYELSGCIAPLTGNLDKPSTVTFSAVGLKVGMTDCQVRIKTLEAAQGLKFEGEPNVLYFVKDMKTQQDIDGNLKADAAMTRLYAPTGTSAALFWLHVPVQFAAPETAALLVGQIACTPPITVPGSFTRSASDAGEFVFATEISAEGPYLCTTFEVRDGSNSPLHTGSFAGEAGKFTATPGGTVKTETLALTKTVESGVDISTKAENCNELGKTYDPATHTCVAAP